MFERRTQDYDIQLTKSKEELSTAKEQLAKVTQQEAALTQQNARMSVELVAGEKGHEAVESELRSVREQLKVREVELGKLKEETREMHSKKQSESESLGKDLEQKNRMLKEYQDKVCVV